MPGYGIAPADGGAGLLPWTWAEHRLERAAAYWLATVTAGGQPHVMPVWGVWEDDGLWFSSSNGSRKTRNLIDRPQATATTDDPQEPVVVEGTVAVRNDPASVAAFTANTNAKYGTDYDVSFFVGSTCFRLDPDKVLALDAADFAGTPTRWTLR